jgi:hypothetical protein
MDQSQDKIDIALPLPEGSIVLRAVEVVQFLHPDGTEGIACRWQGTGNVIAELGMCEYAKMELANVRWSEDEDEASSGNSTD